MNSSGYLNNSKDATVILDENMINKNLKNLTLGFSNKENLFDLDIKHLQGNYNNAEGVKKNPTIKKKESLLDESPISSNKDNTFENKNYNKSINSTESIKKNKKIENNNKNELLNFNENEIESERNINIKKQKHSNIEKSKEKAYLLKNIEERSDGTLLETPYIGFKTGNSIRSNDNSYNDYSYMESARSRSNLNGKIIGKSQAFQIDNQPLGEYELTNKNNNYKTKIKINLESDNHLKIQNKEDNNINNSEESKFNMNSKKSGFKCNESAMISEDEMLNLEIKNSEVVRIIVVDDEKLVRRSQINIISKFMQKKNIIFEIEECEDGIECLYKIYIGVINGVKYDIIITDETMKFMKGSFMAKILKKLITDNVIYDIKIFMVTSYDTNNYADLQGNILEKVFTKPLSMNMIEKIFNLC